MAENGADGSTRGSASAISAGVLQGVQILIVEDTVEVSSAFEKLLRRVGAVGEVAATVDEALRALTEHTFDIVLLDLNLNKQSGIPIAQFARGVASPPIVVVVTGEPGYLDVQRLEELGARVLLKINIRGDLVGFVRSVLDEDRPGTLPPRSGMKMRAKRGIRKARGVARTAPPPSSPETPPLGVRVTIGTSRPELTTMDAFFDEVTGELRGPLGIEQVTSVELRLVLRLRAAAGGPLSTKKMAVDVLDRNDQGGVHAVHNHMSNIRARLRRVGLDPALLLRRSTLGYRSAS